MVAFSSLVSAGFLVAASVNAAPMLQKRIAQVIADSTTAWVAACTKAGGKDQCGTISQTAFTTLLAAGKNCDQQDAADQMVSLAKTLGNDPEMIRLAQLFVQQPRNAPDSLQVPYCQTAPKNAELNGLFHCQFQGTVASGKFSGDQTGNVPLGVAAVNPPGSCPALNTPVPDGQQLNTLVQSPGTPSGGAAAAGAVAAAGADPTDTTGADTGAANSTDTGANGADSAAPAAAGANTVTASVSAASPSAAVTAAAAPAAVAGGDPSKPFLLSNGQAAQKLNAGFATAKAGDACKTGDQACVDGGFAQCVNGKLQAATPCSGGTQCFALPLVNKAGTSVTCDTETDATARIAATGATGGITGSA